MAAKWFNSLDTNSNSLIEFLLPRERACRKAEHNGVNKEFFRTCNVLPFSCTHLASYKDKVKDPKYMQNKKGSRISLGVQTTHLL